MRSLAHLSGSLALMLAAGIVHAADPAPRIVRVQPSGKQVPANLLRISVEFAAPVEGDVPARFALVRRDGSVMPQPFLHQALWSPNGRILTLLLDPARVKTGLAARDTLGPILVPGDAVSVMFDGRLVKRWQIGPVDMRGPVPLNWKLSQVRSGTKQPLIVELDEAIDGRNAGYLAVADASQLPLPGNARLTRGETRWTFTPARPWQAGIYILRVRSSLEDASGNPLGARFETARNASSIQGGDTRLAFRPSTSGRALSQLPPGRTHRSLTSTFNPHH